MRLFRQFLTTLCIIIEPLLIVSLRGAATEPQRSALVRALTLCEQRCEKGERKTGAKKANRKSAGGTKARASRGGKSGSVQRASVGWTVDSSIFWTSARRLGCFGRRWIRHHGCPTETTLEQFDGSEGHQRGDVTARYGECLRRNQPGCFEEMNRVAL